MNQKLKTVLLATITISITYLLMKFPDQSLEASIRGLNMWWEIVFPSLLPFFVTAELLIGFGVVSFIGVLFEPIMRPLFNVPGEGSFAWIMGMASGYPSGAKISTRLREEEQITQIEAERLLSFTNASSPLFIFGAISVGFFHDAKLGILIAVSHYISNAIVGVCMRFYGRKQEEKQIRRSKQRFSIRRAFKEMHNTRMNDPRPFGEVFGDAILHSIQTLVMVGGFIILFSVITKLLFLIGVTPFIAQLMQYGFNLLTIPIDLGLPFVSGLFEITLGTQMISLISTETILPKVMLVSFILGFNGFSVQAQVSSIIAKTDIRFTPYFIARILHGTFACLVTLLLFKPLYLSKQAHHNIDHIPVVNGGEGDYWQTIYQALQTIGPPLTILCLGISILLLYKRSHKQDAI
ncbi:MAG TPA: sporulation integral membrane protein YlbJ [Virgibacillus sp.]|nr:sporulation integral membrane protein YlbJ [Virgibacillus sp.]